MKKGFRDYLNEANAEVELIAPVQAAGLAGDGDTVFVDLRDPREVEREGGIEGARHCPRGMLEFWIDPESPYHKLVFRREKTVRILLRRRLALGARGQNRAGYGPFAGERHPAGGFTAWKKAGLPCRGGGQEMIGSDALSGAQAPRCFP